MNRSFLFFSSFSCGDTELTEYAQRNAHDFMSPMRMKMDESHIYEHIVNSIMKRDI